MELLYSNLKPCEYDNSSFSEAFEKGVVSSDSVKIATGYITEDSLLELKQLLLLYLEEQQIKKCSLVIGMHGREGFTRPQYEAAMELATFLRDNNLGSVRVCTPFKFHGKTYVFAKEGAPMPVLAMLGSSNLGNLLENRQWEVDALFTEGSVLSELDTLHNDLVTKASADILEWTPGPFVATPDLLKDRLDVVRSEGEYEKRESAVGRVFDIPIKTEAKSNLNAYFGKGRKQSNGVIRPRHWYEGELIVPIEIREADGYPEKEVVFKVFTDDGWTFNCKTQGDYGKNFRSEGDLKTLGRWIKGRLERAGCLKVGQPITEEVLTKYGRNSVSLKETNEPGVWLLDFSNETA